MVLRGRFSLRYEWFLMIAQIALGVMIGPAPAIEPTGTLTLACKDTVMRPVWNS
jgi:hypothetical protein